MIAMNRHDIQALKSSLRIEEVIGRYVTLVRRGNSYTGCCPFHADRHPSLAVSIDKQSFTCFACGEKGDVFAFIEKIEHCTFLEAVGKMTHPLPPLERGKVTISSTQTSDIVDIASGVSNSPLERGKGVCDHTNNAHTNRSTFLNTLLPYASGDNDLSAAYLDFEVGQSPVQVPKEWYAMRSRIIFPIRDEAGELVGFAARRMDDSDPDSPKYINSSARSGYHKGDTLYGLHRAKEAIRKTGIAFVTEGYKDTIAMHAAGFTNTVALSGTALTAAHIALLTQYTSRVYLLLDGDRAGQEATRKALSQLITARIEAEGIRLPEGEDPDSLFRKWGKQPFTAMIRKALAAPHSSESALLTACLLYPEAVYPFKGSTYRFAELLYAILPTDNLQFANSDYWQILTHLSEGAPEATLPAPLRMVADELHIAFDRLLAHDLHTLTAILPESKIHVPLYFGKLLYLYTEVRLLGDIRRAVQRLLDTPAANREKRTEILIYIAGRRELLRHVSECMGRPGVIPA